MCGITGFIDRGADRGVSFEALLRRLTDTLAHRGPDDEGTWVDSEMGVGLGHRRLSILDLSPDGHQPMVSASGRYVIVFNGEVYNFAELRARLEASGYSFRGHSDTEVMLAAFEAWGVQRSVEQFVGMFAFGLWDRQERVLYLVRDRFGIKPLYYAEANEVFVFGSELKPLRAHPALDSQVDRDALVQFLRYGYVPAPRTIYEGICKLPPGCFLTVRESGAAMHTELVPYWRLADVVAEGRIAPFTGSDSEAVDALESVLGEAVRLRMVADVPLGAFLSGGVDSSLVVALMQAQSNRPVRTFTIGFTDPRYDEAPHAKAVAEHLGTDHTELYVTQDDVLGVVPLLPHYYDEPFADSSQIPTYLVSELARRHVTVSLSGDGGDELFGGYNRHVRAPRLWQVLRGWPLPLRRAGAHVIERAASVGDGVWMDRLNQVVPARYRVRLPAEKALKIAGLMDVESQEEMYDRLVSVWSAPEEAVIGGGATVPPRTGTELRGGGLEESERMMYLDALTYLPDDILTKVDRATMAVSLEARVPMLDHRVAAFAWRLPATMKVRGDETKWLLRQLLDRYVPRPLIERPKMGFGIPIDAWLRGPLRAWAEDHLNEERLRAEGYLHPEPIRRKWKEHLSGKRNWQHELWSVLMFQAWLAHTESSVPAEAVVNG